MTNEVKVLLASPRGFCAGVDRAIDIVEKTLKKFNSNRRKTAKALNISERTLYRKINEYGMDKKKNGECNKSTYDLIPGSKEKIEKLSRTIYQG